MQGLFLRLCSGGGVSVHGSRGVGSVANRAVCVSLIGESPSRAREHWAQLQPVPVEWGAFCALCCTRGKQRKAAHSDAVPFFGPRHFPFLCIGVVSTLPPPPHPAMCTVSDTAVKYFCSAIFRARVGARAF